MHPDPHTARQGQGSGSLTLEMEKLSLFSFLSFLPTFLFSFEWGVGSNCVAQASLDPPHNPPASVSWVVRFLACDAMPSWLLHFLNITLDKKKQCTFSQILQVILKMNCVLTGRRRNLLFMERCHRKIVLNFLEFIVYKQDIPIIEISKDFLLVRPHPPNS